MPPEILKLLLDMQNAVERVERFAAGRTFDDYKQDDMLRSAVERQFEILGEAMTRLIRSDSDVAKKINEYKKIAGFRNALIHGYDSIDDEISWGVITQKLAILKTDLNSLLPPDPTASPNP